MKTFTTIKLDKLYKVRFGMYELELLEELTGYTGLGFIKKLQIESENVKQKEMLNALYAGMAKELPREFNIKDLAKLIDEYSNLGELLTVVSKAMELAFAVKQDEVVNEGE